MHSSQHSKPVSRTYNFGDLTRQIACADAIGARARGPQPHNVQKLAKRALNSVAACAPRALPMIW